MQDNLQGHNMNEWTDRGWSGMKTILDKEMPVQKKKNRKPWFLFFSSLLILGIASIFIFQWEDDSALSQALPIKIENTKQAKEPKKQIESSSMVKRDYSNDDEIEQKTQKSNKRVSKEDISPTAKKSTTAIETAETIGSNSISNSRASSTTSLQRNRTTKVKRKDTKLDESTYPQFKKAKDVNTKNSILASDINSVSTENKNPFSYSSPAKTRTLAISEVKSTATQISETVLVPAQIASSKVKYENTKYSIAISQSETKFNKVTVPSVKRKTQNNVTLLNIISSSTLMKSDVLLSLRASDKIYEPSFRTQDFIEAEKDHKWNYYIQASAGLDLFSPRVISKTYHSESNLGFIFSRKMGNKFQLESGLSYHFSRLNLEVPISSNYFTTDSDPNNSDILINTNPDSTGFDPPNTPQESTVSDSDILRSITYHGIDVPLHLRYYIKPKFSVHLGANFQYFLYHTTNVIYSGSPMSGRDEYTISLAQADKIRNYNLDGIIGFIFHPWDRWSFGLNYRTNILPGPYDAVISDLVALSSEDNLDQKSIRRYKTLELSTRFRLR